MYVDNELFLCNGTTVAASVTTSAIDIGNTGGFNHPLFFNVGLSEGISVGAVTAIVVQTATDAVFTTPVDEMEIVPSASGQTAACTLAQFFAPLKTKNKYLRLKITAAAGVGETLTGGKLMAVMTNGIPVRL